MSGILFAACASTVMLACGGPPNPSPAGGKKQSVLASIATADSKASVELKKTTPRADATLLSRSVLFANPDRTHPKVSPDGKRFAYLSSVDGVLNVWVSPIGDIAHAQPVTHDTKRGVRNYYWAFNNSHILYLQDAAGDENWHLHAVDLKSGVDKDLTPFEGVQARVEGLSHRVPRDVLVGINDRDKRYHDLYRVSLASGARTLVQRNDGFASYATDDDFKVRLAMKPEKDGSLSVQEPDAKGGFQAFAKIPYEDTTSTQVLGFDREGAKAYLSDTRERDTAALVELDLATKKTKVIFDDLQADIRDMVQHPTSRKVQAALATYDRLRWHAMDASLRADLDVIEKAAPGEIRLLSRSLDDATWVVSSVVSDRPVTFWLYDRSKKKVDFLFSNRKALEDQKLAKMHPVILKARDGLPLVSYLTLPREADADGDARPDVAKGALPMVLLVHGGPWSRDEYGLDPMHQWLASRGYAVMSVNYRGSTGFGKKFVNAADKQWAGKMHEDLLDAVAWAVKEKIAQPDKIAIVGGSYGGYAALVGLTFTPDTFACAVDIVGPSNLVTLLQSIPPYWESEIEQFSKRIGDARTEEGKKFLLSVSPITQAERIRRPLLIGQGANDPRVKQAESDQIVKAMQAKHIPVTYVLYPDEGYGFARPENKKSFFAVTETFLAQCLGGSYEPIGVDFKGSSLTVPAGKEHVVALEESLTK